MNDTREIAGQRILAGLFDLFLSSIAMSVLMLAILLLLGRPPGADAGGPFCADLNHAAAAVVPKTAIAAARQTRVCPHWQLAGWPLTFSIETRSCAQGTGCADTWRPVDRIDPTMSMAGLVFVLGSALSARFFGGQTPGKSVFNLKVSGSGCLLCRELRRGSIFLAWGGFYVLSETLPIPMFWETGLMLVFAIWIWAGYLWPVLRINRPMRYDRKTGFAVIRA